MNFRIILSNLGKVIVLCGALMLLPLTVSFIYGEDGFPFIYAIGIAALVGFILIIYSKPDTSKMSARDGFCIVTMSWIVLSLIGSIPFIVSDQIVSPVDAFFETMSGFTTTGASVLTDVESLDKGLLFWRSLTHWIGGMGVLVFILAIADRNPERSINILRAEMPGSKVDKLRPKAGTTARILYFIYIGLTILEVVFLLFGGMSLYDSLVHTFGTAGTGGFGIKGDSIESYSPYLQYVIAIFMMLFGINFAMYYLILAGRIRSIFRSSELRWYLLIIFIATMIIFLNINIEINDYSESFRLSFFQVSSIITTTGYSTTDFNLWPDLSKAVLLILMFIGGCEGSTAGGFKVSRFMIMSHSVRNEAKHSLHPRIVSAVRINDKIVSKETISSVSSYLGLYVFTFLALFLIISFEPMGFETNFSAVIACFNNIGPGFAGVGPAASFAEYSDLSKIVLSFAMLLGRLEIYPVILSFFRLNVRR